MWPLKEKKESIGKKHPIFLRPEGRSYEVMQEELWKQFNDIRLFKEINEYVKKNKNYKEIIKEIIKKTNGEILYKDDEKEIEKLKKSLNETLGRELENLINEFTEKFKEQKYLFGSGEIDKNKLIDDVITPLENKTNEFLKGKVSDEEFNRISEIFGKIKDEIEKHLGEVREAVQPPNADGKGTTIFGVGVLLFFIILLFKISGGFIGFLLIFVILAIIPAFKKNK